MALKLTPWDNITSFVDDKGRLTMRAQLWLQDALKQLYDEFGALAAAQAAEQAADLANSAAMAANAAALDAQGAANNAQGAANNAQGAANNAQGAADAAAQAQALASSGVTGLAMSAIDAGSSATIIISGHTRVYGDGSSVVVSGGSVNGLGYETDYYVYYSDPDRSGGAVTYQASTNPDNAIQVGDTHSVGEIVTPPSAGPSRDGYPYPPPGIMVRPMP